MPNRPPLTKKLLLVRSFRHIKIKYCREFDSALLSGDESLPAHWLNQKQRHFVHLAAESTVDAEVQAAALELAGRIEGLGNVVYELVETFSERFAAALALSPAERANLREGHAPVELCEVILHNCEPWPSSARELDEAIGPMINNVLCAAVERSRAERHAAGVAPTPAPQDDRHLAVWHKTRATNDNETLFRYLLYEAFELLKVVAIAVMVGALYLAIFLALYHSAPKLTMHEDMLVAGAGIVSVLGGVRLVLARQLVMPGRRGSPGRPGPQDGASGSDGAP